MLDIGFLVPAGLLSVSPCKLRIIIIYFSLLFITANVISTMETAC